jgi:cytochrome c6
LSSVWPKASAAAVLLAAAAASGAHAAEAEPPGKRLFLNATPPCALCHSLNDAGAIGAIGPSLDELKPNAQRVATAVRTGIGLMPPYPDLSDDEVQSIARYVARASGGGD